MQPQYYYGRNFGYIIAFKPHDVYDWMKVTVVDPEAKHYVHKDSSIPASTEFQVKVKAFNIKGEGPYSLTAVIYSAQDGKHRSRIILRLSPTASIGGKTEKLTPDYCTLSAA